MVERLGPSIVRDPNNGTENPTLTPIPVERKWQPKSFFGLFNRQFEAFSLMSQGLSNQEIAEKMVIEPRTVERHIGSIFKKMNISPDPDIDRRIKAVLLYEEKFPASDDAFSVPVLRLSERRMQVLSLMSKAYSNKKIAKELGLGKRTVEAHVWRIFSDLSINDGDKRVKAVLMFRRTRSLKIADADNSGFFGLFNRQFEAFSLMSQGLSNQEIAEKMVIEPRTVERHIGSIFKKMDLPVDSDTDRRIKVATIFWDKFPPQDTGFSLDIQKFLSPRQMQVLSLMSKAYSNKKIAKELGLAETTVDHHVRNILSGLSINDGDRRVKAALLFRLSQQKESRRAMVQEMVGLLTKKLQRFEIGS